MRAEVLKQRTAAVALLMLMSIATAEATEVPVERLIVTSQFAVGYPPGEGWDAVIGEPGSFQQAFPFPDTEENVDFTRASNAEIDGEPEYIFLLGIRRLWPTRAECSLRPADIRRPARTLKRLNELFDRAQANDGNRSLVFDLRQCGKTIAGYTEHYFKNQGFLAAENAAMSGQERAALIDKGATTVGDRSIYFARFEVGDTSESRRWENGSYLYFPAGFGESDLFFYEVNVTASCSSRAGCAELGDTTAPPLALMASLVPHTDAQGMEHAQQPPADSTFAYSKLTAEDGRPDQTLGSSLDIDGETIVVLAGGNLRFRGKGGSAYVFARNAATRQWEQQAKLIDPSPGGRDWTYSSIAIDADTIVLSVPAGPTYVFTRDRATATWSLEASLAIRGSVVAIDGDTIAVGARYDDDYTNGVVHVFTRDAAKHAWSRQATISGEDLDADPRFGLAVALDGDTLLVSDGGKRVSGEVHSSGQPGSVHVLTREQPTGRWSKQATLTASKPNSREGFGSALAIAGNVIVVTAPGPYMSKELSGSADVFVRDESTLRWNHLQRITSGDANTGNTFGNSVAIDGETIAIGAENDTDLRDESGAVYVYRHDPISGTWTRQTKLRARDEYPEDNFGEAVAIDGASLVVGSPNDDDEGADSGSVYVFTLPLK